MAIEISGNTAFITGGGSGIGSGIAQALLEAGARVMIADRDEEALARTQAALQAHGEVHRMVLDVTDRTAMAGAAAEMKERFGGVDILCNNAGIGPLSPMFGDGYEFWDQVMAVNTGGVINGIVSFVPDMVARGRGHIVNTASFGGVMPASGLFGIYTTSKFAVVGLSSALRDTLAGSGVSVTALCPGLVATNLAVNARQSGHSQAAQAEGLDDQAEKILATGIQPVECGRMVVAGIRHDAPFIFTHGELRRQVEEHFDMILSCFPGDEPTAAEHREDLPFFHNS